jgi:hypothetical protein
VPCPFYANKRPVMYTLVFCLVPFPGLLSWKSRTEAPSFGTALAHSYLPCQWPPLLSNIRSHDRGKRKMSLFSHNWRQLKLSLFCFHPTSETGSCGHQIQTCNTKHANIVCLTRSPVVMGFRLDRYAMESP